MGSFGICLEFQESSNKCENESSISDEHLPNDNDTNTSNKEFLPADTDYLNNGVPEDIAKKNASSVENEKSDKQHQLSGGHFTLILANGLSSVAFKFSYTSFQDEPRDIIDILKVCENDIS